MSTDAPTAPRSPSVPSPPSDPRAAHRQAIPPGVPWLLALGALLSLTGLSWDIQWHSDVGPDTFFTLPHLVLYSGVAFSGLTCLVVSLRILAAGRAAGQGLALAPIPRPILFTGVGAAVFLVNGLWDQWWHSLYGFDAVIESPPHIGLLLGIQMTTTGAAVAFAASRRGRARFGAREVGTALATAISASYLVFFFGLAYLLLGWLPLDPAQVYLALVFVGAVVAVAAATRTVFAATLTAALVTAVKVAVGALMVPLTDWYAGSVGLFVRDEELAERSSVLFDLLPSTLLPVALAVDLAVWAGARWRLPGRAVVAVAGAVAAPVLGLTYSVGATFPLFTAGTTSAATLLALGVGGALTALLAWRLGDLTRAVR